MSEESASARVLFVAGEPSGDAQAAKLAAALPRVLPGVAMYGVGGARMRAAGVHTFADVSELSVMGVSEVVTGLGRIRGVYRRVTAELTAARPPDAVVPVDFPEFNLMVARRAKRAGVPVFYYVSPQVWAWRRGRVRKIVRRVDRMAERQGVPGRPPG